MNAKRTAPKSDQRTWLVQFLQLPTSMVEWVIIAIIALICFALFVMPNLEMSSQEWQQEKERLFTSRSPACPASAHD
jgi:hypothetical protein